jgi:hypothetical protein
LVIKVSPATVLNDAINTMVTNSRFKKGRDKPVIYSP